MKRRKRKVRRGEIVCRCGAYPFPHRQMGGCCDGAAVVSAYFEAQTWGECMDCSLREVDDETGEIRCQALEGREELRECPELESHIRHHDIKLYGVNRPPERITRASGALWRR